MALMTKSEQAPVEGVPNVPTHVAIIMDGNGRWAKQHGLPRPEGHRHGVENLRRVLRACVQEGVKILTIYAFSTENWNRPKYEVDALMRLLEMFIERELDELDSQGVQIRHIGDLEGVNLRLARKILSATARTAHNNTLILNVAFNYGGRKEIVQAVKRIVREGVPEDNITEELISRYMYTGDLPDPDLIIRTSGELRVSNFLIWQSSYSEFYVTPTLWPDFDQNEFHLALETYAARTRRFGKTDDQIKG